MADFKTAWAISKINEGGLANNPNDPGGLTYEGISFVNWPSWAGWPIVKANLNNISAVAAQLEPLVIDFYQRYFWSLLGGDFITNSDIANQLFDSALNTGIKGSIEWIQECVNLLGGSLEVDGIMGKNTIAGINGFPTNTTHWLLTSFKVMRGAHYINLINGNPKFKEFYKSWISRLG